MREQKPKFLVKDRGWKTERATTTGEWPFEYSAWRVIYYPYTHDNEDQLIWLESAMEHIHAFVSQNVKMQARIPKYNPQTLMYDDNEELPYCLMCGIFMEKSTWEHFMKCKEMVKCSVEK